MQRILMLIFTRRFIRGTVDSVAGHMGLSSAVHASSSNPINSGRSQQLSFLLWEFVAQYGLIGKPGSKFLGLRQKDC